MTDTEPEIHIDRPLVMYDVAAYDTVQTNDPKLDIRIRPDPTDEFEFPDPHIVLDVETGLACFGPTREEALLDIGKDLRSYQQQSFQGERTGDIVSTPNTLGGAPRVAGSRIGVKHIYTHYQADANSTLADVAASFSGPLTMGEAKAALEWADDHQSEMRQLLREEELFHEWLDAHHPDATEIGSATYVDGNGPSEPEISFEEYKDRHL